MSATNSEAVTAPEGDDGAPVPAPSETRPDVAEGSAEELVGRETRASRKRKATGLPAPRPPVKMGKEAAEPWQILDHALINLPIIERAQACKDELKRRKMLRSALYLIEAYKKFLEYIKARWEDRPTRPWAKKPGSRAFLDAVLRFSNTVVLYATSKEKNPAFAKAFPLSRRADLDIPKMCGKKRMGN